MGKIGKMERHYINAVTSCTKYVAWCKKNPISFLIVPEST